MCVRFCVVCRRSRETGRYVPSTVRCGGGFRRRRQGCVESARPIEGEAWVLLGLMLVCGLAALVATARIGVSIFWAGGTSVPRVLFLEMVPVATLLILCAALTIGAGPVTRYVQDAANSLHTPRAYVNAVLPRQ